MFITMAKQPKDRNNKAKKKKNHYNAETKSQRGWKTPSYFPFEFLQIHFNKFQVTKLTKKCVLKQFLKQYLQPSPPIPYKITIIHFQCNEIQGVTDKRHQKNENTPIDRETAAQIIPSSSALLKIYDYLILNLHIKMQSIPSYILVGNT